MPQAAYNKLTLLQYNDGVKTSTAASYNTIIGLQGDRNTDYTQCCVHIFKKPSFYRILTATPTNH